MATIRPFHGLRYNPSKVGEVSRVIAPPYDVISAEQQEELQKRSPYNVVRLILGRQYDGDSPEDNRYTRAKKKLDQWIGEGALAEDAEPTLYVYEQSFRAAGRDLTRRGVLCALRLSPFGQGEVFPHEETFSAPKADRMHLIKAVRTNLSPIFGLVPDDARALTGVLAASRESAKLLADVTEDSGVTNRLYGVSDPEWTKKIAGALEPNPVFIADGHHRYETALAYRDERRAKEGYKGAYGTRPYDDIMMMCVPMSDPGLVVLPTHRLLRPTPGVRTDELPGCAEKYFAVKEAAPAELEALACEDKEGRTRIGLALRKDGKTYILNLASEAPMAEVLPDRTEAYRRLDVAVLHELLLGRCLGMEASKVHRGEHITYLKDAGESLQRTIAAGADHDAAFILRPTRVDQVRQVAAAGEKMPHKSTYFYPKLLSGLVMRQLTR